MNKNKDVADTLFENMGNTLMEELDLKQDSLDELECEDYEVLGAEKKIEIEKIPMANDAADGIFKRMGEILAKDLEPRKS